MFEKRYTYVHEPGTVDLLLIPDFLRRTKPLITPEGKITVKKKGRVVIHSKGGK